MGWTLEVPDDERAFLVSGVLQSVACKFFFDGWESAKELAGDVRQNGGPARGDAVLGQEKKQAGKEGVDGLGGGEFTEAVREGRGEIGWFALIFGELGVAGTEEGVQVSGGRRQPLALAKRC